MFMVVLKNLDKSDLIKEAAVTGLQETIDHIHDFADHKATITLSELTIQPFDFDHEDNCI